MTKTCRACLILCALLLLYPWFPAPAGAQDYQPHIGQRGKDVIWVPTPDNQVETMLDMAEVTAADFVIDLGSGDGRIVIAAARRGATALGIEFNPDMVELSRRNADKAGVSGRATFEQADLFEVDLGRASVITMYLLPDINLKLRPKLLDLAPGTRVVSHAFSMEEWTPDRSAVNNAVNLYCWIVPAKVGGAWTWTEGSVPVALELTQNFQEIKGTALFGDSPEPVRDAKLQGDWIAFSLGGNSYSGRVTPGSIRGTVRTPGGEAEWVASRPSPDAP